MYIALNLSLISVATNYARGSMLTTLNLRLASLASANNAAHLSRFFKTGPGHYGEGDIFRGIRVPVLRTLVREFSELPIEQSLCLLQSTYHEDRVLALLIWVYQFKRGDEYQQSAIYNLYLTNTARINNWDLVDLSAAQIVGAFLIHKPRTILYKLAKSAMLWERRIAVIATFHFIKYGEYADTLKLCELLIVDKHDLMHKACGWMLREVGKRGGLPQLLRFLDRYAATMPRTMLRYALEHLDAAQKKHYMTLKQKTANYH